MPILWISCHDYVVIKQNKLLEIQVYVLSLKVHGEFVILGRRNTFFHFVKWKKEINLDTHFTTW